MVSEGLILHLITPNPMTADLPNRDEIMAKIPLRRFGEPDEVADAAAFLAKNTYANNCILTLDGGLSAV
jgi:NAD(P)-dependent dehydrogenase (short-subunit alcohol dehydrogenase family)